jgi:hypothetical protein
VQALGEATKKRGRWSSQDDVVDVQKQVGDAVTRFVYKEGWIRSRDSETDLLNVAGEALVPSPGRLLSP